MLNEAADSDCRGVALDLFLDEDHRQDRHVERASNLHKLHCRGEHVGEQLGEHGTCTGPTIGSAS